MSRNFKYDLEPLFKKETSLDALSEENHQNLIDCMVSLYRICFWLANMESSLKIKQLPI
ncbi:MAG: hypothetical protein ACHQAX_02150 [Gammaproteobacteria bacterium]